MQFDQLAGPGGKLFKYNVPGFVAGPPCNLNGGDPVSFDMNGPTTRIYYADAGLNLGVESIGCLPIGNVTGNAGGLPIGVAHDGPEPLD